MRFPFTFYLMASTAVVVHATVTLEGNDLTLRSEHCTLKLSLPGSFVQAIKGDAVATAVAQGPPPGVMKMIEKVQSLVEDHDSGVAACVNPHLAVDGVKVGREVSALLKSAQFVQWDPKLSFENGYVTTECFGSAGGQDGGLYGSYTTPIEYGDLSPVSYEQKGFHLETYDFFGVSGYSSGKRVAEKFCNFIAHIKALVLPAINPDPRFSETNQSDLFLLNGFAPTEIPTVQAADLVRNGSKSPPEVFVRKLDNGEEYEVGVFKGGYVGIARNECGLVLYKDFFFDSHYTFSNSHIQAAGKWDEASLRQAAIDPCSQPPSPDTSLPSIPIRAELLRVEKKPGFRELVCRGDGDNMFAIYRFHVRSRYGPKLREIPEGVRGIWIHAENDGKNAMPEVEAQRFCRMLAMKRNLFIKQVQTAHV